MRAASFMACGMCVSKQPAKWRGAAFALCAWSPEATNAITEARNESIWSHPTPSSHHIYQHFPHHAVICTRSFWRTKFNVIAYGIDMFYIRTYWFAVIMCTRWGLAPTRDTLHSMLYVYGLVWSCGGRKGGSIDGGLSSCGVTRSAHGNRVFFFFSGDAKPLPIADDRVEAQMVEAKLLWAEWLFFLFVTPVVHSKRLNQSR